MPVPSPANARPTSITANAGAIAPITPPSPMQIEAKRALHGIPSRSSAAEPTSENAAMREEEDGGHQSRLAQRDAELVRDRRRGRPDHAGAVAEGRAEQDDADPDARRAGPATAGRYSAIRRGSGRSALASRSARADRARSRGSPRSRRENRHGNENAPFEVAPCPPAGPAEPERDAAPNSSTVNGP